MQSSCGAAKPVRASRRTSSAGAGRDAGLATNAADDLNLVAGIRPRAAGYAPIFPVSDALVLAVHADAVLLVARCGFTRKRALLRLREILRRINANVAGVVLNAVDLKLEHYYSGPYRYGHANKNRCEGGYYSDELQENN